jgi:DNA invertase Pin-like site-specific DNA recombinase
VEAIDTTAATGQFFFQITGAFAELERNLMRERTLAGLISARRRGRKGGRRKAIDPQTFAMALQLYKARARYTVSVRAWALHGAPFIVILPRIGDSRRSKSQ